MKSVGIWIRVSTEDQAQGESPEHHRLRAERYAELKGWDVTTVYDLSGVSGKSVIDHPECQRMMADIEFGTITTLIFSKLARLARNTKELIEISDYFALHKADLISLSEQIDTSSASGRLFFTVVAAMTQWEREEIAERIRASVPIRAKLGKRIGGEAPFGYQWKDGKFLLEPDEAPIRKLMFELFLEEKRLKTVCRRLNERGHRTRKGSKFSDSTLRRLLTDPVAKGKRRSNYTQTASDGATVVFKDESEWEWHDCPSVVTEDVFDQVNAILDARTKNRTPPSKKPVRLFGGLVWCHCGTKMYIRSNSDKYNCGDCHNKIQKDDLESIFVEQLKQFFFSPDEINAYFREQYQSVEAKSEEIRILETEKSKIEKEIDQLFVLHAKGQIPTDGFGARYAPLEKKVNDLEASIPVLQAEVDVLKIENISRIEVTKNAQDLYSKWYELEHDAKRSVIEAIVEKVIVGEEEVEIFLHFVPENPSPPNSTSFSPPPNWSQKGNASSRVHGSHKL